MSWRERRGLFAELDEAAARGGRLAGGRGALLLTTNPGLESLVADELAERLAWIGIDARDLQIERRPLGFHGNVLALLPRIDAEVERAARHLRSVHHLIHPLYAFDLPPVDQSGAEDLLAALAAGLTARGVPPLAAPGVSTFRVTTRRWGTHPFTSIDVQRRAGAALVEGYGRSVDLEHPDCEVRVDVLGPRCLVGVQLTESPLSLRKRGPYHPRAGLKPNVAYGLLRLARLAPGSGAGLRLLDPFCGSATLPIEAAQVLPGLRIDASDYSPEATAGAALNLRAAGLAGRVALKLRDFDELDRCYPAGAFDAIVTNPPFGVRLGRSLNFHSFYERFLEVAAHLLPPEGLLVLLAWKRGLIDRANRSQRRFRRNHVRVIETGGIYPRAYVFSRRRD